MEYIYHYTSIQSLALILETGKIRFSRIDLLDDMHEVRGMPEYVLNYLFVSCWTESSIENIALWNMYTNMKGIRIQLPKNFFEEYTYENGNFKGMEIKDFTYKMPVPIEELRTDNYWICNPFWLEDGFFVEINYTENYKEEKEKSIERSDKGIAIKHVKNLVSFKDTIWEFQKEARFYLFAIPFPPLQECKNDYNLQMEYFSSGFGKYLNKNKFIDISIKREVLDSIVVRGHPNCVFADELIIQSLLEKYTNKGVFERSELEGVIREK
ncbi:hypothetical protein LNQ81_07700 [Myroides sp. M-43]|uniref:hypothetical protein n=1 Tax=Myroides oncorhynchi TaxID=2893756 RepID=UPI001E63734C|nr:hypothetical protein [Myroides oncorhynchi]MCC9042572.1 hypothetical protein [Myroides oncorhynchi]